MIMLPQASGILSDLAHQEMTNDGGVQAHYRVHLKVSTKPGQD